VTRRGDPSEPTLRAPDPGVGVGLFVSGLIESRQVDHLMGLVVDCCGRGGDRPNDRIVGEVAPRLRDGHRVLVHCRSGRSRSTTAAAAVLLDMGLAGTPDEAVRMVALGTGRPPDRRCTSSLREWWSARRQGSLFPTA
jgi:rhodanese-related sulfurtransferase